MHQIKVLPASHAYNCFGDGSATEVFEVTAVTVAEVSELLHPSWVEKLAKSLKLKPTSLVTGEVELWKDWYRGRCQFGLIARVRPAGTNHKMRVGEVACNPN